MLSSLLLLAGASAAHAQVSTYTFPVPRPTPGHIYDGWEAYNPFQVRSSCCMHWRRADNDQPVPEPDPPSPLPALDFPVQLDYGGNPTAGIPVPGSFLGISIEMSLSEAVIGRNASWIRPQFLNLMSTLKERGGAPVLRVGGNSQEKAYLVDEISGGAHSTERQLFGPRTPTNTPTLLFTQASTQTPLAVLYSSPRPLGNL